MDEATIKRHMHQLMYGDNSPKRKPGRPPVPFTPAPTFDGAMAALKPAEADFVRRVLAGDTQQDAHAKAFPGKHLTTSSGGRVAARPRVAHALALGKQAGALAAISGIKYDLTAAHEEIDRHIETAIKQENMNAVASLVREKLKIHKLTDNTPAAMAGAAFTLIIRGPDGDQTITPGHVIDIQAKESQ